MGNKYMGCNFVFRNVSAMNIDQQQASGMSLEGHNAVITGQAGTGKSYTVGKIAKAIQESGKHV